MFGTEGTKTVSAEQALVSANTIVDTGSTALQEAPSSSHWKNAIKHECHALIKDKPWSIVPESKAVVNGPLKLDGELMGPLKVQKYL